MNKKVVAALLLGVLGACVCTQECVGNPISLSLNTQEGLETPAWFPDSEEVSGSANPHIIEANIVGPDERQDITRNAAGYDKAAVVLEMTLEKGKGGCSGSMIAPNVVLTAAHCLYHGQYARSVEVFAAGLAGQGGVNQPRGNQNQPRINPNRPGRNQDPAIRFRDELRNLAPNGRNLFSNRRTPVKPGVTPRQMRKLRGLGRYFTPTAQLEQEVTKAVDLAEDNLGDLNNLFNKLREQGVASGKSIQMWVPEGWKKYCNGKNFLQAEQYDYGIIVLDTALGNKTGYFGMSSQGHQYLQNKEIYVIGRGGDKPHRTLWKSIGRVGKIVQGFMYHSADMVKGNSGGPIVTSNNPNYIIALNNFELDYSGGRQISPDGTYPNGGLLITDKIIRDVQKYL